MSALDLVKHLNWETFSHQALNVYQLSEFNLSFYGKVFQNEGPIALDFIPAIFDINDYFVFQQFLPPWIKDKQEIHCGKAKQASAPIAYCNWTTWADIGEQAHITGVNRLKIFLDWYNPVVFEPLEFSENFPNLILENNRFFEKDDNISHFEYAKSYLDIENIQIKNRSWFRHTLISKTISKETILETVLKDNFVLRITLLPENQFDMSRPISPFAENKVMASFWDFMDHLHISGPADEPPLLNGLKQVKPGIGLDPKTGEKMEKPSAKKLQEPEETDPDSWGW